MGPDRPQIFWAIFRMIFGPQNVQIWGLPEMTKRTRILQNVRVYFITHAPHVKHNLGSGCQRERKKERDRDTKINNFFF